MTSASSSKRQLLLIAFLFLTPFFVAVLMRFGGWQPSTTRNFGELLQPPLSMESVTATDAQSADWPWVNVERHWTLLVQLPAVCDSACLEAAAVLPRVREALGRHVEKLHAFQQGRALGSTDGAMPSLQLSGDLPIPLTELPQSLPQIWLIDPHGYLVMRYREGFDPNGLRRDLSRLIK